MVKSLIGFFLISSIILGIFPINTIATSSNDPFISEINFRGSLSQSRCIKADKINQYKPSTNWCGKDQWLEIYNPNSSQLSLDGYSLELRNQKTISLNGFTIAGKGHFVINFTQSNFLSIINKADLSSYQILYISSESDTDATKHNITAILKLNNNPVDTINIHPNQIDTDYLNARGRSYFRCKSGDSWQKTTSQYGPENNFATPQENDSSCSQVAAAALPIVPPNTSKINPQPSPKPSQTRVESKTSTKTATQKLPIKAISSQVVPEVAPKFQLQNINSFSLSAVSQQNFETKTNLKPSFRTNQEIYFDSLRLPSSNYQNAYRYQLNSLFSYYYQENLSLLNILLLTGLIFRLIHTIDSKIFNLQYVTRIKKRRQPNF